MIYTVQLHDDQKQQFIKQMSGSTKFNIKSEVGFGAFQVDGPKQSVSELESLSSVYAVNKEGDIQFNTDDE
jgi:hypothetical protein